MQAMREGTDLVICDTSGRLHTNIGLMEELAKCKRSIGKRLPGAPHEVLLILDGTTGGDPCCCCCLHQLHCPRIDKASRCCRVPQSSSWRFGACSR